MRPIQLGPYSPVTASTTGLNAANLTGAGPFTPSTTACPDGLGHLITLTVAASNYSGTTVTLTGTDANGMAQTESLAGPNANTVTSTKHFKTVTSITVSASLGGNGMSVGYAAESVSPMIPLEYRSIAAAATTVKVTGTINFTVEETYASPFANAHADCPWVTITALSAKTATTSSTATVGSQALRLKTNTVTNGATLTWYITQASTWAI